MELYRHQHSDMKFVPNESTILTERRIMEENLEREKVHKLERAKRISKRKTCLPNIMKYLTKWRE